MGERTAADDAIDVMQSEAFNFGYRFINDASVRERYLRTVREYVQDIRGRVASGELTPAQAAAEAQVMRNQFLEVSRLRSSDIGRAWAEQLKPQGRTFNELLESYATKKYGKSFLSLAQSEQNLVYLEIVESAARTRPAVDIRMRAAGRVGKGLLVLSLAIAVYNVATAEDKAKAATREGAVLGGGVVGGALGGAAAGLFCGPGAPWCSTALAFVGGVAGALGMDLFMDKVEESASPVQHISGGGSGGGAGW